MKLLLDQGLQRSLVQLLVAQGHSVSDLADLGWEREADEVLISLAIDHGYVIVTRDSDFHQYLAAGQTVSHSGRRRGTKRR